MAGVLDLYNFVQQQGEVGRQRGQQSRLARLASQAYSAAPDQRQQYIAQMAQTSPQAAFDANKQFEGMDDRARQKLGQYAAVFDTLPDDQKPQAYTQLARQAQALNIPAPDQWNPAFAPHIKNIAQAFGGATAEQNRNLVVSPGSAVVDPRTGRQIYERPFAPARPQNATFQVDAEGNGWWLAPGEAPVPATGMPQAAAAPQGGADVMGQVYRQTVNPQGVQGLIKSLAGQFGGQISSLTRSPADNARVDGVPNSQHLAGTAGDVVVPQSQKAAFIAAARLQGLEAIDEGDHVHLELPPGGQRSQAVGPNFGKKPAPSALEERINLARELGATEDEIQRMIIGREGAAAGAKPMPAAALRMVTDANSALKEVDTVNSTLGRIREEIASGQLNLSLIGNVINRGRVAVGMGNAESTKLSTMERSLRGLQNAALRLNKGVQTEGDAKRIWQELLGNLNDEASVLANIDRLMELNQRAQELHEMNLETINENYGRQAGGGGQGGGATARPQTDADFAQLPSGALYIDPEDGKTYRKP